MRKNWKKVVSLLLAASMAMSMNVATFAEEIHEEVAEEVVAEVAEADTLSLNAPSVNTVSDSKVKSNNYQVVVSYTENVSYNGRKHVATTEKATASKANDVEVSVSVCKISDNKVDLVDVTKDVLDTAKTKVAFKNNRDAGEATFTLKLAFKKDWKKANKDDAKTLAKAGKDKANAFKLTIDKLNLGMVSENFVDGKVVAKSLKTKNNKVSGLALTYKFGSKTKKVGLKVSGKKAKDVTVTVSSDKTIIVSADKAAKNYVGSAVVKADKVK